VEAERLQAILAPLDQLMVDLDQRLKALMEVTFLARGFYKRRGQWRLDIWKTALKKNSREG
jgi:hypothetical protein